MDVAGGDAELTSTEQQVGVSGGSVGVADD